jgi:hypothetical protein
VRRFYFDRQTDVSGASGTGAVCEGTVFSDGTVVLRWLTALSSIAVYRNIEDASAIHGHDGSTNLVWVDDEPSLPPGGIEGGYINTRAALAAHKEATDAG